MIDDTATNPAPGGAEVAAISTDDTIADTSNENLDTEGEETQAPVEETEEVDWEGKKYTLPKAIKPALMMQADYTRKTQEVAETRKALEAQQAAIAQQAEAQKANLQEYVRLAAIDDRLAQFQRIDWATLDRDDPVRAQALGREFSMLTYAQRELKDHLSAKEAQALEAQRSDTAKKLQEGRAALAKAIPNFTPELAKNLRDHGTSYGFSAEEVSGIQDARQVQVLHDAYLWRQHVAKQRTAATQKPQTQAEPVPQVTGRRPSPPGLRDDLSMAEWIKRRDAQVRKNA